MNTFKTGDVVRMQSGGPQMTVRGHLKVVAGPSGFISLKLAGHTEDELVCEWFLEGSNSLQNGYFKPDQLIRIEK